MKFKSIIQDKRIIGTGNQGNIICNYYDLVSVLGKPKIENSVDEFFFKTKVTWIIEFEDGIIATIYDYKEYEIGDATLILNWSIGGESKISYDRIVELIDNFKQEQNLFLGVYSNDDVKKIK